MTILPPELLDTILGLVKHLDSLRSCMLSSPYITPHAENHLYKKIKVRASAAPASSVSDDILQVNISELNDLLKRNPRIEGLVQSLEITTDEVYVFGDSPIPQLRSLVAVSIYPEHPTNPVHWSSVDGTVRAFWENLVCLPTIEEVKIRILDVPLRILDQCRGIRRLSLDFSFDHSSRRQRTPPPFASGLQHLAFYDLKQVHNWLTEGFSQLHLQSVHLESMIVADTLASVIKSLTQRVSSSTLKELKFTLLSDGEYEVFQQTIQTAEDETTSEFVLYKTCEVSDIPTFPVLNKIVIRTIIQLYLGYNLSDPRPYPTYCSFLPEIGSFLQTVHTAALREVEICLVVQRDGPWFPTLAEVDFSSIAQLYSTSSSTETPQFPRIDLTFRERPPDYFDSQPFDLLLSELQNNHVVAQLMREKKVLVHGPVGGYVG